MATATTTLWSTAVIKAWVGITNPGEISQDAVLERIADAVSQHIEQRTRVKWVTRTITETRDGDGTRTLFLHERPVTAFTSLQILRYPTDAAAELIDTDSYRVDLSRGVIWMHSDYFNIGIGNVTATYTAGYGAQDAATLPQDIVEAGLDLVKLIYDQKFRGAQLAQSITLGSATFFIKPDYPQHIKDIFDNRFRPDIL